MTEPAPLPRLHLRLIPVTPLQQNCSLLWDEASKDAVMVDPGGDIETLTNALGEFGLTLKQIWLTHGHADHAGAAAELRERTGALIFGPHRDDQYLLDGLEGGRFRMAGARNVTPDRYLDDGDTLDLGDVRFAVAHTPGHTPGHVVIHNAAAQIAFVGDVLFAGSIGRTDLPRGDQAALIASITGKLWPLGDDVTFIPGHGPPSTFGQERQTNPFVGDRLTGYAGAETKAPDAIDQRLAKRHQ